MGGRSGRFSCAIALLLACAAAGAQQPRTNAFNDPFVQATSALPGCPVPEGPLYTGEEVRALAHIRAQHGGSCYRSGRCRLPNSYLYDAEIVPRVRQFIREDGRFGDTSVWVLGQRRIVTLMGCVRSVEQGRALEQAAGLVDDVMGVVNLLHVPGDAAAPVRYPLAR